MQSDFRELPLCLRIPERVVLALEERLMRVHPAAVLSENRLRHERGEQSELLGNMLHHEPKGGDVVRSSERIGIPKIDLVLAMGDLVVCRLDLESHLLEHRDHRPSRLFAEIGGGPHREAPPPPGRCGWASRGPRPPTEKTRRRPADLRCAQTRWR